MAVSNILQYSLKFSAFLWNSLTGLATRHKKSIRTELALMLDILPKVSSFSLFLVVFHKCLLLKPLTVRHTHAYQFSIGRIGTLRQQDLLIQNHLLQILADFLDTLSGNQPLHLMMDLPFMLTIHGRMNIMK